MSQWNSVPTVGDWRESTARHTLPTLRPEGVAIYLHRLRRVVLFWAIAGLGAGIPLLAAPALARAFDASTEGGVSVMGCLGFALAADIRLGWRVLSHWRAEEDNSD